MSLSMRVVVMGAACVGWLVSVAPSVAGPPALLAQAQYVALGYDLGNGFVSDSDVFMDVLPDDRTALQRIRAGLEAWGRYEIVLRPDDADLLIAIRRGRPVSVAGGISDPSSGARGQPVGAGQFGNAQISSPDDMIEVFDKSRVLVWRGIKPKGLSGAAPPLLDSFRAEVLKADTRTRKP